MPLCFENICSCGSKTNYFSWIMAQRSFKSRYSFVVSYDRITAWNEVNILGEFFTSDVKMNSYRDC